MEARIATAPSSMHAIACRSSPKSGRYCCLSRSTSRAHRLRASSSQSEGRTLAAENEELKRERSASGRKYDLQSQLFAQLDFARVNAFTDDPFGGNPAAICYLPYEKEDDWLQRVAKEFNLSETAFLTRRYQVKGDEEAVAGEDDEEPAEYDLRWFTPKVEVDLCGHATLAAAHLLFFTLVEQDTILFHTRSGILKARKIAGYNLQDEPKLPEGNVYLKKPTRRSSGKGIVELDFPIAVISPCGPEETAQVCKALDVPDCIWCGMSDLGDFLVELSSIDHVKAVTPSFNEMLNFPGRGGVIVTARAPADNEVDFISRFFCPKSGVLEDPVTGSAHCSLGPYWAKKLGKCNLEAYQASERGGNVTVRVSETENRVYLQGCAIMVMAGVLLNVVPPEEIEEVIQAKPNKTTDQK